LVQPFKNGLFQCSQKVKGPKTYLTLTFLLLVGVHVSRSLLLSTKNVYIR